MKILDVRYDQMPSIKQVTQKSDYDKVQKFIYEKEGKVITPWGMLDIQQKGNIIVFVEDWSCEVDVYKNGKRVTYKYDFECGFISDKGSIPPKLRSFVDNDDPDFLVGFYIHDANYACHFFDRSNSDKLLRGMGKYHGSGSYKAGKVYWAVWFAGADAYESDDIGILKQKKWVKFKEVK